MATATSIPTAANSSIKPPSPGRPPGGPESRIQSMRQIKQVRGGSRLDRKRSLRSHGLDWYRSIHHHDTATPPQPPTPPLQQLSLHEANNCLEVVWGDGACAVFHGFWLRDNATAYFDPQTGQRTRNTLALGPNAYSLAAAERAPSEAAGGTKMAVRMAFRDGFTATFASAFLRQHGHETRHEYRIRPRLWGNDLYGAFPGHVMPTLAWTHVVEAAGAGAGGQWQRGGRGFVEWITALRDFGVALVDGVPLLPDAAMRLAKLISYHRKTHYGDVFQVKSEAKPSHLAYTPVELEVHTDLNYRESSPGIQVGDGMMRTKARE
jgi:[2-(trimethylamino)ethyl]phosphonate dioxygenase